MFCATPFSTTRTTTTTGVRIARVCYYYTRLEGVDVEEIEFAVNLNVLGVEPVYSRRRRHYMQ